MAIQRDEILGMSLSLEVAQDVLLFLFLGADGRIERMGDGEQREGPSVDRTLYSGTTSAGYFESLLPYVTDEMLEAPGSYDLPDIAGERCRLRLLFQLRGNRTSGLEFDYGSESEGPPSEVRDLVFAALDLTEPWFSQQGRTLEA